MTGYDVMLRALAILTALGLVALGVYGIDRWAAGSGDRPCFTHVPDPAMMAARQCEMGATVKPINGVALCVCPEVLP